jgi:catalase-peroxidase
MVPDAHRPDVRHAPIMFTTDIALREDPGFRKITKRWQKNPQEFADAFAQAWFKLTHRDMGPQARYRGKDAPKVTLKWQDPLPKANYAPISAEDIVQLKASILASDLTTAELVRTAWASASTFRSTDMRGGANGGRLRLAPQKDWAVNDPAEVSKVVAKLETVRTAFNKGAKGGQQVSIADLIVLGGNAAIEQAAKAAGQDVTVPFNAGRVDAGQDQTDVDSFNQLQPKADGFRNYFASDAYFGPTEALIDKADLLGLTVAETTVLVGGMRVLGANAGGSTAGVFTSKPGTLTNDFFTNLLSMDTVWAKSATNAGLYEGKDRATGAAKWTATPVDLVFGSNAELRAVAEVYASDDAKEKFVADFIAAWTKVMDADRFQ